MEYPEEKLAARLLLRHNLTPPIDPEKLVREMARLEYRKIPISGVDGVSIAMKVPNRRPLVVVNSSITPSRQRFTLAHELGHLVIPWHVGLVIADLSENIASPTQNLDYHIMEQEANRFAAAFLMPKYWMLEQCQIATDLASLQKLICNITGLSALAVAIRMISILNKKMVFAATENGQTKFSGKAEGTFQSPPSVGDELTSFVIVDYSEYSVFESATLRFHWWELPTDIKPMPISGDKQDWREILAGIAEDLNPVEGSDKFKMTVNAIIASANGKLKRTSNYTISSLTAACRQRLARPDLIKLVNHPDFGVFISRKIEDLFDNNW